MGNIRGGKMRYCQGTQCHEYKTKAEKIAERLKYEAENGSVKFEKTETSLN